MVPVDSLLDDLFEARIAWISSAAARIFFMQLGFLLYEVGYVKKVWGPSVILKNIEDTFVVELNQFTK